MPEPDPPAPIPASSAAAVASPGEAPRLDIQLQNSGRYREVAARRLRPWVTALVAGLAPAARSLGISFVSDRAMRQYNHTYRSKDKTTDVLSFPGDLAEASSTGTSAGRAADGADPDVFAGFPEDDEPHLGDIIVSVPTARRQAARAGHGVERELRILILHGVLHCLGHDHETDDGTMERLENDLRQQWIDHE